MHLHDMGVELAGEDGTFGSPYDPVATTTLDAAMSPVGVSTRNRTPSLVRRVARTELRTGRSARHQRQQPPADRRPNLTQPARAVPDAVITQRSTPAGLTDPRMSFLWQVSAPGVAR